MQIKFLKPKLSHVEEMEKVVYPEVESGVILERSSDEVATNIRSYTLVYVGTELVGFAALHIHTIELAEVRSLIIKDGFRGKKIGEKLVNYILQEGVELGIKKVLSLTYKQSFFERLGFVEIPKESLPQHKIWADCIKCKHFPICNEVSLIKEL